MATSNAFILFLYLSLLSFLTLNTDAAPTYLDHYCLNETTFPSNGTYQTYLNLLFISLSSNATRDNGFYNVTIGQSPPDVAYGLFLCRGDVTTDVCQECVVTASREVQEYCSGNKGAFIWYDVCTLRYSNQTSFSTVAIVPSISMSNSQNISEPDRFNQLLSRTMNALVSQAANDQSDKKFATNEENFTSFQTLYCLVQCTPDLSVSGCNTCLIAAVGDLPTCCNGKEGGSVLLPSCNIRYDVNPFYQINATATPRAPTPVLPPPSSVINPTGKRNTSSQKIVAIVVPVAVSVVLFAVGFCFLRRRGRKKRDAIGEAYAQVDEEITTVQSLKFDFGTIAAATNNFSVDNKIGEGGFGEVYRGVLYGGQEIAVKRLSRSSGQGTEEFKNEVLLVAKLQHRNLVKLLGFCLDGEEKILVYEFVPNKSLDYFLFDSEKQGILDWSRRYKIIQGVARGILYLHQDSRLRIIHRDLKTSNILLDGEMNAKISDFGMARIFGLDQTQGNTNRIVGTFGYMSPEYAMHGQFSVKSDVYSFGVLVLELISGKRNGNFYQSDGPEDLLSYAWKHWRDGTPLELLDPTLRNSYSRNEYIRCTQIGFLCVHEDPAERPTMATIVLMLDSYSVTLPLPRQPAFFLHSRTGLSMQAKDPESDQSTSKSMSMPFSVNEESITEVYPR